MGLSLALPAASHPQVPALGGVCRRRGPASPRTRAAALGLISHRPQAGRRRPASLCLPACGLLPVHSKNHCSMKEEDTHPAVSQPGRVSPKDDSPGPAPQGRSSGPPGLLSAPPSPSQPEGCRKEMELHLPPEWAAMALPPAQALSRWTFTSLRPLRETPGARPPWGPALSWFWSHKVSAYLQGWEYPARGQGSTVHLGRWT